MALAACSPPQPKSATVPAPQPAIVTQPSIAPRPVAAVTGTPTETLVPLEQDGGTLRVPVRINDAIELKFTIDSGAADVSIPADVASTLVRTGTITDDDFIGNQTFVLADGSTVPSAEFRIRSLRVGTLELRNVTASLADRKGPLLLGQSFLTRLTSWSVDNQRQVLILKTTTGALTGTVSAPAQEATAAEAQSGGPTLADSQPVPPPQAEASQIARDAVSKTEAFFTVWSAPHNPDGEGVRQYYASAINYYGTVTSVDDVMKQNLQFCRRWPLRRYTIRAPSVSVSCSSTNVCTVSGVLDWDAASPVRSAHSSGVAQFIFGFRDGLIEMEGGKVLSRVTNQRPAEQ
jgi:gag-polyprotein putative aspartyl protease